MKRQSSSYHLVQYDTASPDIRLLPIIPLVILLLKHLRRRIAEGTARGVQYARLIHEVS